MSQPPSPNQYHHHQWTTPKSPTSTAARSCRRDPSPSGAEEETQTQNLLRHDLFPSSADEQQHQRHLFADFVTDQLLRPKVVLPSLSQLSSGIPLSWPISAFIYVCCWKGIVFLFCRSASWHHPKRCCGIGYGIPNLTTASLCLSFLLLSLSVFVSCSSLCLFASDLSWELRLGCDKFLLHEY